MENNVFFSESGLTATSANHICNVAKEYIQSITKRLENVSFTNCDLKIIGSKDTGRIEYGCDNINWIEKALIEVAEYKSLIAWLREAIKAKEKRTHDLDEYGFEDYLKDHEIILPKVIDLHILTEVEYYDSLPIKERNRYYQLETQAASIGKYIHPDGRFSEQRDKLKDLLNNPIQVDKNGRDTLIYEYSASLDPNEVDDLFFKLQVKHRSIQSQLNQIKFECEQAIADSKDEHDRIMKSSYEQYVEARNKVDSDYQIYLNDRRQEIKRLKIVIPDSLKHVYERIAQIGK